MISLNDLADLVAKGMNRAVNQDPRVTKLTRIEKWVRDGYMILGAIISVTIPVFLASKVGFFQTFSIWLFSAFCLAILHLILLKQIDRRVEDRKAEIRKEYLTQLKEDLLKAANNQKDSKE